MGTTTTRWWDPLERSSPTLFILAAAVLSSLLVIGLAARYVGTSVPRTAYWPLFPLAIALSLLGLLGLVPRLADRAWRWALVVGGFGLVGVALLVAGLGGLLLVSPPGPYPGTLGPLGAPFFLGLLAFVAATVISGAVGLRSGPPDRRIGAVLLLVGGLQLLELVGAEVLFSSAGTGAPTPSYLLFETAVYGLVATGWLVVGLSLRRGLSPAVADDTPSRHGSPADAS